MSDIDGDYEKRCEADEQEIRRFDEQAEGEGEPKGDNPRYLLAPSYFADYLENRPSARAGQSLRRAFGMWSDVEGVSSDVRAAVAQIGDDEELEQDVWQSRGSRHRGGFPQGWQEQRGSSPGGRARPAREFTVRQGVAAANNRHYLVLRGRSRPREEELRRSAWPGHERLRVPARGPGRGCTRSTT